MLLLITNPYVAVILLGFWYIQFNSKRYINLIFSFIFINGSVNAGLKFLFKSPLHESLDNPCWYSFPSGHMQYALVFWGILWINMNYNLKFLAVIILLLIASGWSMHQHNYHTTFEMIGAIPPAAAILGLYSAVLKRINFTKNNLLWLNLISIIIQLIVLGLIKSPCEYYKFSWMWLNVGVNLGFGCISLIIQDTAENIMQELKKRVISPTFYYISLLLILELIGIYKLTHLYQTDIANLIYGILFPIMLFLTAKLYQRFNRTNG